MFYNFTCRATLHVSYIFIPVGFRTLIFTFFFSRNNGEIRNNSAQGPLVVFSDAVSLYSN